MRDADTREIGDGVPLHELLVLFRCEVRIQPQGEPAVHDGEDAGVADGIAEGNHFPRLREVRIDGKMDIKIPEIVPAADDFDDAQDYDREQQDNCDHHSCSRGTGISSRRFCRYWTLSRWLWLTRVRRWGRTHSASSFTSSGIT